MICSYRDRAADPVAMVEGRSRLALDQWIDLPVSVLYGTMTTEDPWKFGVFHRKARQIQKDINTFASSNDLSQVVSTLFGITLPAP